MTDLAAGGRADDTDLSLVAAVNGRERALLGELTVGAAVSAAAGGALWLRGRRSGRPALAAFGRQNVGWAVVDLAIAAWGRRSSSRTPTLDVGSAATKARRLRTLTAVNAALDVGYVAAGAGLARRPERRGDGLGIVVQGAFLLWLDARHSKGFHRLLDRG
jgi:hypothetical protein